MQNKLIDLTGFRKRNKLTQGDLASILNVSRAYIAQVEGGRTRLACDRIDHLLSKGDTYDTLALIPCFDRLQALALALYKKDKDDYLSKVARSIPMEENNTPFFGILGENEIELIRHGREPITDIIADRIIHAFPQVRKAWLTTGEGEMFDGTEQRLLAIERKQDEILDLLKEILLKKG